MEHAHFLLNAPNVYLAAMVHVVWCHVVYVLGMWYLYDVIEYAYHIHVCDAWYLHTHLTLCVVYGTHSHTSSYGLCMLHTHTQRMGGVWDTHTSSYGCCMGHTHLILWVVYGTHLIILVVYGTHLIPWVVYVTHLMLVVYGTHLILRVVYGTLVRVLVSLTLQQPFRFRWPGCTSQWAEAWVSNTYTHLNGLIIHSCINQFSVANGFACISTVPAGGNDCVACCDHESLTHEKPRVTDSWASASHWLMRSRESLTHEKPRVTDSWASASHWLMRSHESLTHEKPRATASWEAASHWLMRSHESLTHEKPWITNSWEAMSH